MFKDAIEFFKEYFNFEKENADETVLKGHVEHLEKNVGDIDKNIAVQQTDTTGYYKEKKRVKKELSGFDFEYAQSVLSFATDNKDDALFNKFNTPISIIGRLPDIDLTTFSTTLIDALNQYSKVLVPYGVSAENIKNLTEKNKEFSALLLQPELQSDKKKRATENIKTLIADTRTLIEDSIDRDMGQYITDKPELYALYKNATEIDDSITIHHSIFGTVLHADTKYPVQAGAVTVIRMAEGKEEILAQVKTGEKGNYQCKIKEDGMMIIRFTCPGCLALDKKERIFEDKGVRLDVELLIDEDYVAPEEEEKE